MYGGVSVNYKLRAMAENIFGMEKIAESSIKQFQYKGARPFDGIDRENEKMAIYWKKL